MVSQARILLNGLSRVHFRFESRVYLLHLLLLLLLVRSPAWLLEERNHDVFSSLFGVSTDRLLVLLLLFTYTKKKKFFFLLKIILVWSVWAEKYFSHWQISSLCWSGQFFKWILVYFSSIICLIILLTLYALESSIYKAPEMSFLFNLVSELCMNKSYLCWSRTNFEFPAKIIKVFLLSWSYMTTD